MILDPQQLSPGRMYQWMIGLIVPRPIAWISTRSATGALNLAPFSYFAPITNRPPLVGVSIQKRGDAPKDTLRNIRDTGEFVVNLVDEPLAERMVHTSGDWPAEVDEFALSGLTPAPCERVAAPRVAESPAAFECRLHREVAFGEATFVVGEILLGHVADDRLADGRVDPRRLAAVGRLGADGYTVVREVLRIPRPVVEPPSGGSGA
uniref:Flavin reductase family protein n=1 Tax=Eiseniibacteriota bacterium TaxID=2212470 RepID=A0A832I0H7_UNCEI